MNNSDINFKQKQLNVCFEVVYLYMAHTFYRRFILLLVGLFAARSSSASRARKTNFTSNICVFGNFGACLHLGDSTLIFRIASLCATRVFLLYLCVRHATHVCSAQGKRRQRERKVHHREKSPNLRMMPMCALRVA